MKPLRMRAVWTCAIALLGAAAAARASAADDPFASAALREKLQTLVVIYAENRSFDNVFGSFPGARGLGEVIGADGAALPAYRAQRDRDGSLLPALPPTWGGVTAAGMTPVVTQAQSANLPNAPFAVETAFEPASGVRLSSASVTRDLVHRFIEHQMQIHGGANDEFAAWSDAGGLSLGHFDSRGSKLYRLAQQYTLADEFFQGAFGGSFLNHQYLICACAPEYPAADAPPSGAHPTIAVLERDASGDDLPRLKTAAASPASALSGPPVYELSGNLVPASYFGDGVYHAVNTMQPAYQPSGNKPADAEGDHLLYASAAADTTLPPQRQTHIGDLLDAARVPWAWYAGSWKAALADGMQDPAAKRSVIYAPAGPRGTPDFQAHHAPFNYYADLDPVKHAAERALHLRDYADLLADAAAGTLPPVVFYKPQGNLNQHEGYANLEDGDAHLAELIAALQAGPQWKSMVVVLTYDEFGGTWDHVAPPQGDRLGPGTRIPALIVSPLARKGFVDHTSYDTGSILRLIARRHGLPPLAGIAARDRALASHGAPPMGDLTAALVLQPDGPTGLGARDDARRSGRVRLTWDALPAARRYLVFAGTEAGAESYQPVPASLARTAPNRVSGVVSGLTPGRTYYFRVSAVLRNGETTAFSSEAGAAPHAAVPR